MRNMILILGLICAHLFGATTTPPSLETTQSPNLILAGPTSGGAAIPSFRALATADFGSKIIPNTAVTSGAALSGTVLTSDGAGGATWVAGAGGGSPGGAAGGSLSGTYPNPNLAATIADAVNFTGTHKVNGVTYFLQSSKPTANNFGDLWYETTATGIASYWWQWINDGGGRWVSVQDNVAFFSSGALTNQTFYINIDRGPSSTYQAFVTTMTIQSFMSTGGGGGANYWSFILGASTASVAITTLSTISTQPDANGIFVGHNATINTFIDPATNPLLRLVLGASGSTPSLTYSVTIRYKWVHP